MSRRECKTASKRKGFKLTVFRDEYFFLSSRNPQKALNASKIEDLNLLWVIPSYRRSAFEYLHSRRISYANWTCQSFSVFVRLKRCFKQYGSRRERYYLNESNIISLSASFRLFAVQ